jgi:hypothetical protein
MAQEYVEFVVNEPYPRILELLGEASIGLNTMVDEHFGINVVEFMVCYAQQRVKKRLIGGFHVSRFRPLG